MKKIIKFIKNNILGFLVGLSLCLNGVVIAENIITANQVIYNDSTVQTELDSLFDAVDINERLGNTDISSIGNGTVSGAISQLNNNKADKAIIYRSDQPLTTYTLWTDWSDPNCDVSRGHNVFLVITGVAMNGTFSNGSIYYLIIGNNNVTYLYPLSEQSGSPTISSTAFNSDTSEITINLNSASRLLVVPVR